MWMCSEQPHEYANYIIDANLSTYLIEITFKRPVGIRHKAQTSVLQEE